MTNSQSNSSSGRHELPLMPSSSTDSGVSTAAGLTTLASEFRAAAIAKNFERISELLRLFVIFVEQNALADQPRANRLETPVKPDWVEARLSNIAISGNELSLINRRWSSKESISLSDVLLGGIEEIPILAVGVAELSRDNILQVFSHSGYVFTDAMISKHRAWRQRVDQQLLQSGAATTNSCAESDSKPKRRSLPVLPADLNAATPASIASFEKFNHGDEFKNFICPNPFVYGEVRADGDMATCCYLPFVFGNIKRDGLEGAWNSPAAKAVRRSILDGSYSFCDKRKCATMQQVTNPEKRASYDYQIPYTLFTREQVAEGRLAKTMEGQMDLESPGPKMISFEDDPSCNLSCPSCRIKPIMISQDESASMYDLEVSLLDALGPQLEEVWFAGAGDPFVSRSYRRLYKEYDFERFPNLKFRIDTNGVPLTPKTWNELLGKVKHKVGLVCFSVDATTAETYAVTRRGGNFELLMKNLEFISKVPERKAGMGMLLRMIVQRKNFREMKDFVRLGQRLGVDAVVFSLLQNWGTFEKSDYATEAVHLTGNPLHAELKEILKDPVFEDDIVNLGNLSDLYFAVRGGRESQKATKVPAQPKQTNGRTSKYNARALAFYLPQFHPVPENDQWWGRGFTEWTNVTKAKPLFTGHVQPQLPTELGFYDLRLPESREAQADLAREYGIEAFCYWHYWFGGRRILERPFEEMVKLRKPNFGFCFGWANASWTGVWHGAPNRTLIEQTYPGIEDYRQHFYAMLPALRDERYFRVNGKPLVLVYAPHEMPNAMQFTNFWRELAKKEGVGDLHFVAHMHQDPTPFGCDTAVQNAPFAQLQSTQLNVAPSNGAEVPQVWSYKSYVAEMRAKPIAPREHPIVFPNWDNTPRSGSRGIVLHDASPDLLLEHMRDATRRAQQFANPEERIVFIKAWNEWAEGNYLEPDITYGRGRLEAVRTALTEDLSAAERPATVIVETKHPLPEVAAPSRGGLTSSIQVVVERADSHAARGDFSAALSEMESVASSDSFPGAVMRLAEWNMAVGKSEAAIRAALKELTTRPDNERALQILLHDRDMLMKVLAEASAPTVNLVQHILNSYAQRGA